MVRSEWGEGKRYEGKDKMIKGKRGEEFVEAAIVLPLVILTILSMIMVAVFLFGYQLKQTEAHVALIHEVSGSGRVFGIARRSASSSKSIQGTYSGDASKSKSFRAYELSQADAVMLGELA